MWSLVGAGFRGGWWYVWQERPIGSYNLISGVVPGTRYALCQYIHAAQMRFGKEIANLPFSIFGLVEHYQGASLVKYSVGSLLQYSCIITVYYRVFKLHYRAYTAAPKRQRYGLFSSRTGKQIKRWGCWYNENKYLVQRLISPAWFMVDVRSGFGISGIVWFCCK